jgi:hypothetical protein
MFFFFISVKTKRGEVTGGWRKMHNKELQNVYSSQNIIRIIKSRCMRWAGHLARMRKKRNTYRILVGKPEGKRPLGRPRHRLVGILKWIIERKEGMIWIGFILLKIGTSG